MRKDPPVDEAYIQATYLLEYAQSMGVTVVNHPKSLRDCNEKVFIASFPTFIPPTLVTQSSKQLQHFCHQYQEIVLKPLNQKGGVNVHHVRESDQNKLDLFKRMNQDETCFTMAQQFIPEISEGDKRIILVDGKPIPHALLRIPKSGDWLGNLSAGAIGKVVPLSLRDQLICKTIGPELKRRGLYFVGIDVIGEYLTEINVTSPTGIREIEAATHCNISAMLFDALIER